MWLSIHMPGLGQGLISDYQLRGRRGHRARGKGDWELKDRKGKGDRYFMLDIGRNIG